MSDIPMNLKKISKQKLSGFHLLTHNPAYQKKVGKKRACMKHSTVVREMTRRRMPHRSPCK
jgi:hypothetical protein